MKLDARKRCKRCRSTRAALDDYQTILGRIYEWRCKNVEQCIRRSRAQREKRRSANVPPQRSGKGE